VAALHQNVRTSERKGKIQKTVRDPTIGKAEKTVAVSSGWHVGQHCWDRCFFRWIAVAVCELVCKPL
jgi:hypothetical protein